jgi:hypothetical protein
MAADSFEREKPPADEKVSSRTLRLKGPQLALERALAGMNADLARMYQGALVVLGDDSNPDRVALSAHGFRELMEKLPAYMDVAMPAHRGSLKSEAKNAQAVWTRSVRQTACRQPDGTWSGQVDVHLQKAIRAVEAFFSWIDENLPRRRDEIDQALTRLDPGGPGIPAPLQSLNITRWQTMQDFFVPVSHHKLQTTAQDLARWAEELERFLLERLVPRTFDDQDEIDRVIAEAARGQTDG